MLSKLLIGTKSIIKRLSRFLVNKIKDFIKVEYLSFMCLFVTTILAIATTFVSYMQWNSMQEQLDEMKLARKSELRPYIVHSLQDELIEPNKKISFNVTTVNYGKSPALSIIKFQQIFYGQNAEKNTNKWFEKYHGKPYDIFGKSIVPPTEGNALIYTTVESDKVLSLKEYEDFKKGTYPIIVVVKEDYSDVAGNGYSSETAILLRPNNALVVLRNNIM